MNKTKIIVDIPKKILTIDGNSMRLEDSFTGAYVDHEGSREQALNLVYRGKFSEDNSPINEEMDKLRENFGYDLSDRLTISGMILDYAHYLSFCDDIDPVIEGMSRQCYDILQSLDIRNNRTTL